jgi:hypothetical protein
MDQTAYRYNLEYRAQIRATIALAFLNGKFGVIETARRLHEFIDVDEIFGDH